MYVQNILRRDSAAELSDTDVICATWLSLCISCLLFSGGMMISISCEREHYSHTDHLLTCKGSQATIAGEVRYIKGTDQPDLLVIVPHQYIWTIRRSTAASDE